MSSPGDLSSLRTNSEDSSADAAGSSLAVDPAIAGGATRRPTALRVLSTALAAGLIAGLVAWFLTEPMHGKFLPKLKGSKGMPSAAEAEANANKVKAGESVEVSVVNAVLGAVLGMSLGLAGGFARGSVRAGLAAGVSGLVLAATCGFAASWVLTPVYQKLFQPDSGIDLGLAILMQGVEAAMVGAVAGAAFGLGLGDDGRRLDLRTVVGGLLGAVAGVIVYQLIGAIAFPLDRTTHPISAMGTTRLLSQESVAALVALGVVTARSVESRAK